MKDLQVKVNLESENIPIGKDKYSLDEIKKQQALAEQFEKAKAKLANNKFKEGTEWNDCFTLAVINSKKKTLQSNAKKPVKNEKESAEGEDET